MKFQNGLAIFLGVLILTIIFKIQNASDECQIIVNIHFDILIVCDLNSIYSKPYNSKVLEEIQET